MRSLLIALWFRLRPYEPHAAVDIFIIASRGVFVVQLVLAGAIAVFGCLASAAARSPRCPGVLMEEYGSLSFMGLFIGSVWMAFMVSRAAWPTPRMREQTEKSFEEVAGITHSDTSVEMTGDVLSAYAVLLTICAVSIGLTWVAIMHYLAIRYDCPTVIAPH